MAPETHWLQNQRFNGTKPISYLRILFDNVFALFGTILFSAEKGRKLQFPKACSHFLLEKTLEHSSSVRVSPFPKFYNHWYHTITSDKRHNSVKILVAKNTIFRIFGDSRLKPQLLSSSDFIAPIFGVFPLFLRTVQISL